MTAQTEWHWISAGAYATTDNTYYATNRDPHSGMRLGHWQVWAVSHNGTLRHIVSEHDTLADAKNSVA